MSTTVTIDPERLAEITRHCMACGGPVEEALDPCAGCTVLFCRECFVDHCVPEGCGNFTEIHAWLLSLTCEYRADGQPRRGQPALNRIYGRVEVQRRTGCFAYQGRCDESGYGIVVHEGKATKAHRIGWELLIGELSDEEKVLHRCDNPCCVNPAHWFIGTIGDNNRDRAAKGRTRNGADDRAYPRGQGHWRAKLDDRQIEEIRARRASGETTIALGRAYGVNPATISRIARRVWRQEVA